MAKGEEPVYPNVYTESQRKDFNEENEELRRPATLPKRREREKGTKKRLY